MSEVRTPMLPMKVDYHCDECIGAIPMESTGISLMSNPPQYIHRCPKCKVEKTFVGVEYPRMEYVPVVLEDVK